MRSPTRLRMPSDSPGEQRLVHRQPTGVDQRAVGDELVAGLDADDVAGDDLVGDELDRAPVTHHLRPRRDQQGELIEGLLRLQLLADPDRRVDDRDHAEERVGKEAEREHEDEEAAEDGVEEREDVGADDARHRAAVGRLGRAEASQPAFGLGARQSPDPWSAAASLTRSFIDDQVRRRDRASARAPGSSDRRPRCRRA